MIQPQILRDQVKEHLLKQIGKGELQIGKTINLAALSRKIGISVTPIREALSQLEHARIIKAIPNRGFIVQKLGATEAEHLYDTIAQLEVMALENSRFSPSSIADLNNILQKSSVTQNLDERIQLRFRFHEILVQSCNNPILVQIVTDLKTRLLFYEQALQQDVSFYEQIDAQHKAVIEAIEEDNVPTAALILKMHWVNALKHIQNQLDTTQNI
ncbi:GntR family transcriptional regulator [Flagellimonas allohymeniacidonis]|uniref:GntR family transcriptional regulator n=1 Tax=Flagellimonas allohymeniacidonis TaxID=2517819 RepID=A0A4Q8QE73_9FLAO|nr:GntR family transcriptional regulator [Allomuricauda hymeniacidonis]TAI48792.1 GntR family transcriptional regulator [Allomuricauda hymeniacidonis]